MSDETTNPEGTGGDGDGGGKKAKEPKHLTVRVLRAVDAYHHRGSTLKVPNDEYHRGLVAQGNLKAVE